MASNGLAVQIRDLRYRYDPSGEVFALQGIDLEIRRGEYILLCGASGSGKSTLCRTFNGLIPHFYGGELSGQVIVDGLDTRAHPVHVLFRHAGLVLQNPDAQLFNSTVENELAFGLASLGRSRAEIWAGIARAAETTGIAHLLHSPPHELSGGEKQLVAIAALLAAEPPLLVLDEPFAHLDPANAARIRTALRDIHRRGTTIVLTEHRLRDIIEDVDRVVVLDQGRVVLDGTPREVLSQDVEAFGLNLPLPVRWFREHGWVGTPLSVEEAIKWAAQPHPPPSSPDGETAVVRRGGVSRLTSPLLTRSVSFQEKGLGSEASPMLAAENVEFAFAPSPFVFQPREAQTKMALAGASLQVFKGESLAIVGQNGSGKTTLVKHFNGLLKPRRGTVRVLGCDTRRTKVSELVRTVGLGFQDPNDQFFCSSVADEIAAGPRALGVFDQAWFDEVVDLFQVRPFLARSPYQLSEGEKRRVAFASILTSRPEVLVLDEPTAGQDRRSRDALGQLLADLRRRGHTIVLVTHDLEFAEEHADRWAVMTDGRIIAAGLPDVIMHHPTTLAAAGLRPTQRFQIEQALSIEAWFQSPGSFVPEVGT